MRKFFRITREIISDVIYGFLYFIENQLLNFSRLLYFMLPYLMLFIGEYVYRFRGGYAIGSEVFIPVFILIIAWLLRSYANKIGKGTEVPTPEKRFTEISDEGEVLVERERLNELLIYMADLEDYLEHKGLL